MFTSIGVVVSPTSWKFASAGAIPPRSSMKNAVATGVAAIARLAEAPPAER